ncbi:MULTISPECIES: sigma-70 family RNA polymerase sigma factor [Kitasatospora]|uniref:Putative RNA polymerase ECF subfamily sigma factor n=1 Tax=Kitasatospora setae (strain ATCC 33774 / DSM 43861 / JCM 3304 / KCC A-0304 / NBRC 14216 / KM-6054) TaxID=452652 RepID=E4NDM8_KITSK|nr:MULTISPECIES: sigma-70 family RNA polymerase sigma factor [Kitasatospora]BAJ29309.1 putative RNA polymerase ECF subfamily sigma factor [Kitasatospora setae KM-6054]
MADEETARLVEAAQRGDAFAMDELITVLTPYVGRICAPIALDQATDAVQEALIAVFRGLPGLRAPEALYGWVRVVAVREAVRVAQRHRPEVAVPDLGELPSDEDPELSGDVADVLRRLGPRQRAVLVLRHLEGLDEQQVARLLDVPVGTVRSRLFRARESFRRAWG